MDNVLNVLHHDPLDVVQLVVHHGQLRARPTSGVLFQRVLDKGI